MLNYTTETISKILSASTIAPKDTRPLLVNQVLTDSRSANVTQNTLFFAIKGNKNNGHHFVEDLYEKGVRMFVVSEFLTEFSDLNEAYFFKVENTLKALQTLAIHHRNSFQLDVVGITGSNGKTIVKEWLFQLLQADKKIVRSPKSYNSQLGVPLSVLQISQNDELGIFEAGISMPNEMQQLTPIIAPKIGIFTNIGDAHAENFETIEQKVIEKLKLFTNSQLLIFSSKYEVIERFAKENQQLKLFKWGYQANDDLKIKNQLIANNSTILILEFQQQSFEIEIPFTDQASVENALHCVSLLLCLNYDIKIIQQRILQLHAVNMRLELIKANQNAIIVNDTYNSDLQSIKIAIDYLHQQQKNIKTVILSDVLESNKNQVETYQYIANLINTSNINQFIGVGEKMLAYAHLFQVPTKIYLDTNTLLKDIDKINFEDNAILVKGARKFHFEDIVKYLQQQHHETVLNINLNALIHNLNYYRSKLLPTTKVMAMVKAFSYGSGAYEIANILQYNKIDYLAVAYIDEGIALRQAGISVPIIVMNPDIHNLRSLITYNLEPEIFSFRLLEAFIQVLHQNLLFVESSFKIHIKLDTGMKRLGFEENDITHLLTILVQEKNLKIASVFSHLVGSEDESLDEFTQIQIQRFESMANKIEHAFNYKIDKHLLNSAGISRWTNYQYDMVRLGIGLYGIANTDEEQKYLQNVSSLQTTISQIRTIKANETVGYNRKGKVTRDSVLATVPIGYADGIRRALGNGNIAFFVNNQPAKIVGNVCMDMCMIDITNIPAKEGDKVVVFENALQIKNIAKQLNTIPYEVLTSISPRVKRVYIQE